MTAYEPLHYRLGGSALARTVECTGSLLAQENLPGFESDAATEGTLAHQCFEDMNLGIDFAFEYYDYEYPLEMIEHVTWAYEKTLPHEGDCFVEHRVDFSNYLPETAKGTVDLLYLKDRTARLFDLKYGLQPVEALNNIQLAAYALGVDADYYELTILQPRLRRVRTWEIDRVSLESWFKDNVLSKVIEALDPAQRTFSPGESSCRYCKASGRCRAQTLGALALSNSEVLTDEDLVKIYPRIAELKAWVKAVESRVRDGMLEGEIEIPGYQIGPGRSSRVWNDGADLSWVDDDVLFETNVRSVAQLERIVGKKSLVNLWHKVVGQPVVKKIK